MATDWGTWRKIGPNPNEDASPGIPDIGQFKNGWLEFQAGGANPQSQGGIPTEPAYFLDNNRVWMKGQVRAGAMSSAIFRLPVYASPAGPRLISTVAVPAAGGIIPVVLEIMPDDVGGALVIPRGAANVRLALDGAFIIV